MNQHQYYRHLGRGISRVIRAEANQEDDGGFFARLGGLEPDTDADGPTAKGLFQNMTRNNDENGADCHTPWENRYNKIRGHTGHGLTTDEYLELEQSRREGMKLAANYIRKKYGRKPIVRVEKHSDWGDGLGAWAWDCRICVSTEYHDTWADAYRRADHHAHNHHKGWGL